MCTAVDRPNAQEPNGDGMDGRHVFGVGGRGVLTTTLACRVTMVGIPTVLTATYVPAPGPGPVRYRSFYGKGARYQLHTYIHNISARALPPQLQRTPRSGRRQHRGVG